MFSSKVLISSTVVAAYASAALAQSISSGCQTALAGILANSDAACLNPSGLLGVVSAGSDTSLVSPLDKWAQGMCGQAACTNSSLSAVVNALLPACSAELSSITGTETSAAEVTTLVQTYYPPLREAVCLQDTSSKTLCPTEFLTGVQSVTGPLTLNNLESLATSIAGGTIPNLPTNVTCTDCTKGWYNIAQKEVPGLLNSEASSSISQTCGASFVDGTTPSTVAAFGSTSNNTANGAASVGLTFAAIALPLVSSAFALLA